MSYDIVSTGTGIEAVGGGSTVNNFPEQSNISTNIPQVQMAITESDFTLQASNATQTAFPTTCDVWTLEANTTYIFEGCYHMTVGTTTHTTAMSFALGGGASVTSINYSVIGWNGVAATTATAQGTVWVDTVASTVVTATAATAGNHLWFKGIIRMNAAGTLTPQITFSANPGGTNLMKKDSYIMFTKVGTGTFESIGNVA